MYSRYRKFDSSALYSPSLPFLSPPPPLTIDAKLVYRGPDKHGGHEEVLTKMCQKRDKLPTMTRQFSCHLLISVMLLLFLRVGMSL